MLDLLIDEISEAAYEAIEQAAGEAAKAAVLSMLEREAVALREAALQQAEVTRWRMDAQNNFEAIQTAKSNGRKNTLLAALLGILGGLVLGISGSLILGGR